MYSLVCATKIYLSHFNVDKKYSNDTPYYKFNVASMIVDATVIFSLSCLVKFQGTFDHILECSLCLPVE